jgi:hypothetical protein
MVLAVLMRIASRWLVHDALQENEKIATFAPNAGRNVPREDPPEDLFSNLEMRHVHAAILLASRVHTHSGLGDSMTISTGV